MCTVRRWLSEGFCAERGAEQGAHAQRPKGYATEKCGRSCECDAVTSVSMCEMRCESSISGTCNNVVCGMCGGESRLESREQAEREIEMREREREKTAFDT